MPNAWSGGSRLRIGAIGVLARRAVDAGETEKGDVPDNWNEIEEYPPAAETDVMQAPHGYGKSGKHCRQRKKSAEDAKSKVFVIDADGVVNDRKHDKNGHAEEHEVPVFSALSATSEVEEIGKGLTNPVHFWLPPDSRAYNKESMTALRWLAARP